MNSVNIYIKFTETFKYKGTDYQSRRLNKDGIPKKNKESAYNNLIENKLDKDKDNINYKDYNISLIKKLIYLLKYLIHYIKKEKNGIRNDYKYDKVAAELNKEKYKNEMENIKINKKQIRCKMAKAESTKDNILKELKENYQQKKEYKGALGSEKDINIYKEHKYYINCWLDKDNNDLYIRIIKSKNENEVKDEKNKLNQEIKEDIKQKNEQYYKLKKNNNSNSDIRNNNTLNNIIKNNNTLNNNI